MAIDVLDELAWRGQVHQVTDEKGLREHLRSPRAVYCGFDPTADSLTIGNLVPMMLLRRFAKAGHKVIVVVGGATGRIGDPSGKDAERTLMTDAHVDGNIEGQRPSFQRVLGDDVEIIDNYDWFRGMGFIEALRMLGKHFSVNAMIQRDAVRKRLEDRDQGLSYTEFSYMLLQAYDFYHLYATKGVTVQMAGSDQWGNIVSGVDLIRRIYSAMPIAAVRHAVAAAEHAAVGDAVATAHAAMESAKYAALAADPGVAFGLTAPLLVKADGGKFGKSEKGAVWLSAARTSPYAFYQFWINAEDSEVGKLIRIFTDLTKDQVEELERAHAAAPQERSAQRTLAREVTRMIHGDTALARAEAATTALFSGDVAGLDVATINEAFADVPQSTHDRADLLPDGIAMADVLAMTTLVKSKREAKEFLASGGVSLNGAKAGPEERLTVPRLLHSRFALIRRGKKAWHVMKWE